MHPCLRAAALRAPRRPFAPIALAAGLAALALPLPLAAQPSGELSADPNPCANGSGVDYCKDPFPTLEWTTSGLNGNDTPNVQLRVNDSIVKCGAANVSDSKTLGEGIKIKKAGKTFTLWAASDCTSYPFHEIFLDSVYVQNDEPQGRIWATPNPCLIPQGETGCHPLIEWDSLNLTSAKVLITVNGNPFHCDDANEQGSKQTVGVQIGATPKTFALYEVPNCSSSGSTPLATVQASSYPAGTPVCSVDNQALSGSVAPEFFGIIDNYSNTSNLGPIDDIGDLMAAADVRYLRRTVRWNRVEAVEGTFNFGFYTSLFDAYDDLEPWITLSHTPGWAVASGLCDPQAQNNDCHTYPPEHDEDWRTYVRETVEQFGPGTAYDVRNFEVWQEPDATFNGTPERYVELLNIAYNEIGVLEATMGAMTVWAPNTIFHPDRSDDEGKFHAIVDEVLADGDFDGFAIHTFHRESYRNVHSVEYTRNLLDSNGFTGTPLAVTAVSYPDCPDLWPALADAEQARLLRDAYVCLANAGASQVMWFEAPDRPIDCPPPGQPTNDDKGVVLRVYDELTEPPVAYVEKEHMYTVIGEIGAYINAP